MVLSKKEAIANIIVSQREAAANNDLSIKETPAGNRVDHISALPDHLLHHILSFLPTRDAIKTSILSRRWQYMWRPTPVLYLDHDDHYGRWCRCPSVLDFAHQWLRDRDLIASLHSFHLSFLRGDVEVESSHVAALLNHAAGWPLHELYLRFPNMVRFTLPSYIFSLTSLGVLPSLWVLGSLRVLTLRNISLDRFPPSTLLPSLEILDLSGVEFASDIARDFVTRSCPRLRRCRIMHTLHGAPKLDIDCPLLEVLELEYLDVVWLRIAGERLKTLRIRECFSLQLDPLNQALLISTPNLETFWWSNKPPHHVFMQRPMSSLSSANIEIGSDNDRLFVDSYIRQIGFTSVVFAGAAALVLAVLDSTCPKLEMRQLELKFLGKGVVEGHIQQSATLTCGGVEHLCLRVDLSDTLSLFGIAFLLQYAPSLKTLEIYSVTSCTEDEFASYFTGFGPGGFWESQGLSLERLSCVRIFAASREKPYPYQMDFIEFLLRNGTALKEMTIVIPNYNEIIASRGVSINETAAYIRWQKIWKIPRVSSCVELSLRG